MFLAIAFIVLLVGGFFAWRYFSTYESTDDAEVDGHLMPLSARISGYILKVNVDDNQYVTPEPCWRKSIRATIRWRWTKRKAQLADAQATAQASNINVPITSVNTTSQVSLSEADVENARAGILAAQQQYDAAKAQLAQAEANNVKAQNDLVRYKQLVDKQEISKQMYDQAVAAARASTATVAAARASAAAAAQQVTQAQSKLAQAEANLRYAQTGPSRLRPRVRGLFRPTPPCSKKKRRSNRRN